jgi:hypothetical protein
MAQKRQAKPAQRGKGKSPPRNRRLVLVLLGVAVLLGGGTWLLLSKRPPAPAAEFHGGARLAVDKDLIDLGAVKLGQRVHASFRLRNIGDRVLLLPSDPPVDVVEGC